MDDVPVMARHAFENMQAFLAGKTIRAADLIVDPKHPRPAPRP
jgi:hypothetical protein